MVEQSPSSRAATITSDSAPPQPVSTSGMAGMRGLLLAAAWIILGGTIITAMVLFSLARRAAVPTSQAVVIPLCIFGAGLVLALIYFGLAVIIRGALAQLKLARFMARSVDRNLLVLGNLERQLLHLQATIDQVASVAVNNPIPAPAESLHKPSAPAAATAPAVPTDSSPQILELLTQLRDAALLTEPQRLQWANGLLAKRKAALAAEVNAAIAAERWKNAASLIEKIQETLPGDALAATLSRELANKRGEKRDQDIHAAQARLQHLMAINEWDQVQQIAEMLESRYPDEPTVQELANRVRREQEAWHREGLQSLFTDYKDAVDHRQWTRACNLAQQILERYPQDKLADKIRGDLVTLRQNAEIQARHELETQYADLIKRQRHEEAFAIAQRVLDTYPESPTANKMRQHLPKLLEVIKQEKARKESAVPKL